MLNIFHKWDLFYNFFSRLGRRYFQQKSNFHWRFKKYGAFVRKRRSRPSWTNDQEILITIQRSEIRKFRVWPTGNETFVLPERRWSCIEVIQGWLPQWILRSTYFISTSSWFTVWTKKIPRCLGHVWCY